MVSMFRDENSTLRNETIKVKDQFIQNRICKVVGRDGGRGKTTFYEISPSFDNLKKYQLLFSRYSKMVSSNTYSSRNIKIWYYSADFSTCRTYLSQDLILTILGTQGLELQSSPSQICSLHYNWCPVTRIQKGQFLLYKNKKSHS